MGVVVVGEGVLDGEVSLETFAATHSVALTRFAYLLCGDRQHAEDLVQDAFLAMHRRFGDILHLDNPLAYARKIIVNGRISAARRRSAQELITDVLPETAASAPSDTAHMWQALARLSERQRAVLVMRFWLDLPDDQIGAALGCRPGTVRSLASRAMEQLRSSHTLEELA